MKQFDLASFGLFYLKKCPVEEYTRNNEQRPEDGGN